MQKDKVWGEIAVSTINATTAMEDLGKAMTDLGEAVKTDMPEQKEIQLFSEQLDFDTAMQFLIDDRNKSTVEFNEVFDELEALKKENEVLTTMNELLKTENNDVKLILVDAEKLAEKHTGLASNYQSLVSQKETTDKLLKVANKDLKQAKQNASKHKASNASLLKRNERLTKEAKAERAKRVVDIPQLNTVFEIENEVLIVYPQIHKMNNGTKMVEQAVLLYTDMRGCFLTAYLDENNEAVFSSPMRPNDLSERTIATYRKHSISPSQEAQDFATKWLYRVNIQQKTKVERIDLVKFTGNA